MYRHGVFTLCCRGGYSVDVPPSHLTLLLLLMNLIAVHGLKMHVLFETIKKKKQKTKKGSRVRKEYERNESTDEGIVRLPLCLSVFYVHRPRTNKKQ